jgi:hypothetical protein
MKRLMTLTVAAATCALVGLSGVTGLAPANAAAAPTTTPTTPAASTAGSTAGAAARLAAIQARAAAAIAARVASLNRTIPAVTSNTVITATDKATLLATLHGDLAGLPPLGQKIAADTTVAQAQADYETIFTTYRVYALALPQVRYAAAADDITGGILPKLTSADASLAALLIGVDAGKDTPAVQAEMTDLGARISAVTSSTNGLSATVLADTPAQYDANHALLSQPRATLRTVRADISAARADIVKVMAALQ